MAAEYIFPDNKRLILAYCLKVLVEILYSTHMYKFDDDIFMQIGGIPTGLSTSVDNSKITMTLWLRKVENTLLKNSSKLFLSFLYVDDYRYFGAGFKLGLTFDPVSKSIIFSEDQYVQDLNDK